MSRPMRWITVLATTTAAVVAVLVTPGLLPRAAADCPDVEVVFGRGQGEPPGLGAVGDAFVTALQAKSGRPIASYAVNYPAANLDIAPGVADMTAHIESTAANCPNTRFILGGYSLGGAVTFQVLNNGLSPGIDQRVIGVATFGNAARALNLPTTVLPQYAGKTLDQCNPGDPACSGVPFWPAHLQPFYIMGGPVETAAGAAASLL
jgi:cutinase